ncbi:phage tail tape measure protein [Rhodoferax sp.]|uniref:phage tail tape measure protein n=1 Tax=Rhodoferax sp. TaxID=50421 RepID=UPI002ACE66CD|nr:phage tail tape measure protein [Rhodoferax sp.]MDZ7920761.1 phage tail tape measure protein [Rhodoferax sp.]
MSTTYIVGVRIDGNAGGYLRATQQAQAATRSFSSNMRAELQRLKSFMSSTQGQLAQLGVGVGLVTVAKQAAVLQRNLTQVSLAAGMSVQQQSDAYKTMFDLIKKNGGVMEDTVGGFAELTQAGLKYKEAMEATKAVSLASAVTGATSGTLSGALTVGAANFGFDLSETGRAALMLDKMRVAGQSGRAELEDLSNIFSKVAQNAKKSNMSFETTLAFIEGLSLVSNKDTLGTLADSTTRLFSNANYLKDAQAATGVRFFEKDAKGNDSARRDPIAVLEDMRKGYAKLTTDAQRFSYVSKAFGKADLDTQRGLQALLGGDMLEKIRQFETAQKNAKGNVAADAPRALAGAAVQAERLRNTLRQAGEAFATPVNDAVANAIKYMLDSKEDGGAGLSGGQVLGGAAVGAAGVYAAARFLPGVLGKVVGRGAGLAAGVAEGKALQAAAGVTPVYVTNWAEMNGGGSGVAEAAGGAAAAAAAAGKLSKLRNMAGVAALLGNAPLGALARAGAGGLAAMAGGAALAGGAGYAVGTGIYKYGLEGNAGGDMIGESIAKVLAFFGNSEAQRSVAVTEALKNTKVGGEITIRVSGAPGLGVQTDTKAMPGTRLSSLGQTNQGAGL